MAGVALVILGGNAAYQTSTCIALFAEVLEANLRCRSSLSDFEKFIVRSHDPLSPCPRRHNYSSHFLDELGTTRGALFTGSSTITAIVVKHQRWFRCGVSQTSWDLGPSGRHAGGI
jgi:hypothetical protein